MTIQNARVRVSTDHQLAPQRTKQTHSLHIWFDYVDWILTVDDRAFRFALQMKHNATATNYLGNNNEEWNYWVPNGNDFRGIAIDSHECKHSTTVVASIRYPLHRLHVIWGFMVLSRTLGGFLGIDRYVLFVSTVAIPALRFARLRSIENWCSLLAQHK